MLVDPQRVVWSRSQECLELVITPGGHPCARPADHHGIEGLGDRPLVIDLAVNWYGRRAFALYERPIRLGPPTRVPDVQLGSCRMVDAHPVCAIEGVLLPLSRIVELGAVAVVVGIVEPDLAPGGADQTECRWEGTSRIEVGVSGDDRLGCTR